MVEVYPCGTVVKTIIGNIEGMITAQTLRFERVQYEISYFMNQEQRCIWMNENEFTTDITNQKIGFKIS